MLNLMLLIATVLKLCSDADADVLFNNPSAKVLQQQMGAIIAEAFKAYTDVLFSKVSKKLTRFF